MCNTAGRFILSYLSSLKSIDHNIYIYMSHQQHPRVCLQMRHRDVFIRDDVITATPSKPSFGGVEGHYWHLHVDWASMTSLLRQTRRLVSLLLRSAQTKNAKD